MSFVFIGSYGNISGRSLDEEILLNYLCCWPRDASARMSCMTREVPTDLRYIQGTLNTADVLESSKLSMASKDQIVLGMMKYRTTLRISHG